MTTVGLVLGAGGVIGRAYHAGVLAALQEVASWDARSAEIIIGTSAGSVDGAMLRAGLSARDLAARSIGEPVSPDAAALLRHAPAPINSTIPHPYHSIWRPAAPGCFFSAARRPWGLRLGTLAAAALPEGVVPAEGLIRLIDPLYGSSWPARRLWICAVRLEDGRRVVFGRDALPPARVSEAVRASCAIPGWFCPVRLDGARFVDGGAYSLTNADLLAGVGLDLVIVSSPMSATPGAWRGSVDGALRAMSHLRLRREMVRLRAKGTRVVVLEPDARDVAVMGSLAEAMDGRRRAAVAHWIRNAMGDRLRRMGVDDLLRHADEPSVGATT